MSTSRLALVGLGVILGVGLVAFGVIWLSGDGTIPFVVPEPAVAPPPPPITVASLAPLAPSAPVPEPEPAAGPLPPGVPPPAATHGARKASPPGTSWDLVPVFQRASNFGAPLAPAVTRGLAEMRTRIEPCYDEEIAREKARAPGRRRSTGQHLGPALLVLRIQGHLDALEVVAADLVSAGSSSQDLVDCCRRVIEGFAMDAPGSGPGQRYRLNYPLQP
jgi:hypothetical protein